MSTPTDRLDAIRARAEAATVEGFPEYEVQADGTVWSLRNWRGYGRRQVVPVEGEGGYLKVRLVAPDGRRCNRAVHRLVVEAFLGPRPQGEQVRHLSGDQTDNRASNLAYGTAAENAADRDVHGTTARGSRNGQSHLDERVVREIRQASMGGASQRAIAVRFGVSQRTVGRVLRGEGWAHV